MKLQFHLNPSFSLFSWMCKVEIGILLNNIPMIFRWENSLQEVSIAV